MKNNLFDEKTSSRLKLQKDCKLDKEITLAFSGGVDSASALHYLMNKHKVSLIHINHNENTSEEHEAFCRSLAKSWGLNIQVVKIQGEKPKGKTLEQWWHEERYKIFHSIPTQVITCHHLDDCIENWIMTSMLGNGKLIPRQNGNVIRPFRLLRKQTFLNYAIKNYLTWIEDSSNYNTDFTRNYVRHIMMSHCLRINPGLPKTIRKKILME